MTPQQLAFGPFRLIPEQRVLLRDGDPVAVSRYEWDILVALAEHAGDTLKKSELMLRAWPSGLAQETTLRVYISRLRGILEEVKDGPCYIESVRGRGYRFVALVIRVAEAEVLGKAGLPSSRIPLAPQRLVGREEVLGRLVAHLPHRRFITIVGPCGVGKTALAVAALHSLLPHHFRDMYVVGLGSIVDPAQAVTTIAAALGLTTVAADPIPEIVEHIRQRRVLIVLDNCEHVVESIARVVERLLTRAPELHILATSREPLRAEGESVLRLTPLALPPPAAVLTIPQTLAFPAVNLFVQRVTESRETFEFPAADVPIVVAICRRLDGLPLAIELAVAHVNLLGVRALASHPSERLLRLTRGPRTVIPRHRSLRATLDWSHKTLSPVEQAALRRLAIFDGWFDIESAVAVLAGDDIQAADIVAIVISLASKSLLGSSLIDDTAFFHLLQTSRAYALEKLSASGERKGVEQRHARWQQRRRVDLA